jgi:hypothetical protein
MLIAKASGRKYGYFPILGLRPMDASKHNSDEVGRYLFDCVTYSLTPRRTYTSYLLPACPGAREGGPIAERIKEESARYDHRRTFSYRQKLGGCVTLRLRLRKRTSR